MRQYAPFYLWATIIAVLAFGLGVRIGTANDYGYYHVDPQHWMGIHYTGRRTGWFDWFHD